nr:MAG TPA: hypothetical protein [Caudoviricetes sp.]
MRLKCSHNHRETPLYLLVTNILVYYLTQY